MNPKTKSPIVCITFGVVLYAALMNLNTVLSFLKNMAGLILPILLGLVFAFILNVPMRGFERILNRLSSKRKHPLRSRFLRSGSLVLTLLCIVLVITLAVTIAIPEVVASVKSISPLIKEQWPVWVSALDSINIDISQISEWFADLDLKNLFGSASRLWDSAVGVATSTVSGAANTVFAFVIAIYVLLSKNVLAAQAKKLMTAHLKKVTAERVLYMACLVRDTYARFLSGQCVEAVLLGILIFIAYSIFGLPYAGLVAFLTGIFSFVPFVGAFAACFIGAFLTLLAAPSQVIVCVAVYLVVQFIENQFIYPHVVGNSVGLSPLWTLVAALLGGKLFGLPGIVFFIPLMAVFYTLVREYTNKKLREQ